jgi:hypothetical protein
MARTYTEAEKAELRARTLRVLDGGPREYPGNPERDWIGNKWDKQASKINALLIRGATGAQLQAIRKTYKQHLYRLEKGMGIPIVREGDRYRFDRSKL